MVRAYESRYNNEVVTAPPRMLAAKGYAKSSFEKGKEYFENFDMFEGYTVLNTEEEFMIDLPMPDGTTRKLCGFIDMVLEDNNTKELIVCDHKSKSLSAFKKAADEMYKQQLIYSIYINQKYGKYPDRMMFNLFKEGGLKDERPFTLDALEETIAWAQEQIEKIESFDFFDWLTQKEIECGKEDFFCQNLCSMRKYCDNGKPKTKSRKKK